MSKTATALQAQEQDGVPHTLSQASQAPAASETRTGSTSRASLGTEQFDASKASVHHAGTRKERQRKAQEKPEKSQANYLTRKNTQPNTSNGTCNFCTGCGSQLEQERHLLPKSPTRCPRPPRLTTCRVLNEALSPGAFVTLC